MTTSFSSQRQLINELQIIIPKSIIHLIHTPYTVEHSIPYHSATPTIKKIWNFFFLLKPEQNSIITLTKR